jgi:hypothetical protein
MQETQIVRKREKARRAHICKLGSLSLSASTSHRMHMHFDARQFSPSRSSHRTPALPLKINLMGQPQKALKQYAQSVDKP